MPLTITDVASICYAANYQLGVGPSIYKEFTWADAPEHIKQATVYTVRRALAFPDLTAERIHEHWLALKLKNGWKYSKTLDVFGKKSSCIVPYDELSKEDLLIINLFIAIVNAAKPFITPPDEDSSPEA